MTARGVATLLVIALALAAVYQVFRPFPALSQDHHPAHRDFYRGWLQPNGSGMSCCNARVEVNGIETGDCEPTKAEIRKGDWWVWVRQIGDWIRVPDAKIIRERNPSGQDAHHCWTPASGTICFSPPDTGG